MRGEGFGRILWERSKRSNKNRLTLLAWVTFVYPISRLRLITSNVLKWGDGLRDKFITSFPLVVIGVLSAAAGAAAILMRSPVERSPADAPTDGAARP